MRLDKIAARSFSVFCALTLAATQAEANRLDNEAAVIAGIQRYCTTSWWSARLPESTWDDNTQEVFLRMLERVPQPRWKIALAEQDSQERRELKRAVWSVAKRQQRAPRPLSLDELLPMLTDERAQECPWTIAELVEQAVRDELHRLNATQTKILLLYCQGHKAADIASVLGASTSQVSDQKYRALCKLRKLVDARLGDEERHG